MLKTEPRHGERYTKALNRRGLAAFVAITFGLTYAIEGTMIATGVRLGAAPPFAAQLAVLAVMWVPALATLLTLRFVTHEPSTRVNLRFGSWRAYLGAALLIPLCFTAIYGLTWLLGLGRPDWQLRELFALVASGGADMAQAPPPSVILVVLLLVSLTAAPFVNSIAAFGEELGWRGYLLPALLPLGRVRAYLIVGVLWGLWHAPLVLIGFNYPGHPLLGILGMIGLTTSFGVYVNEMTLRHRSTILAAWMHGVFNSQAYGIWRVLFPHANPLLGGLGGVVGIAVWLLIALGYQRMVARHGSEPPARVPLPHGARP